MTDEIPELIHQVAIRDDIEIPELVRPKVEIAPNPYDIALIIDGIVFQVMNVDGQSAAQFMAQPTFVRVGKDDNVKVGWRYADGKFMPPPPEELAGY